MQGQILAQGTQDEMIVFHPLNTTEGWQGVRFDQTPATNPESVLEYCEFAYGHATDGK